MNKFSVIVADPPWSFQDSLKMSDVKRGAKANYPTMTMLQIKAMPVKSVCNPDGAVLCLWVPGSLLQEGLDTMKAWGFNHKQTYIWVKTKKSPTEFLKKQILKSSKAAMKLIHYITTSAQKYSYPKEEIKTYGDLISDKIKKFSLNDVLAFGMGRLFRQTHEICLIGVSGSKIYKQLENKSRRSVCLEENLRHSAKPENLQDSLELMFPKARKLELFARRIRPGWTCLGNEVCNGEDINVSISKL
jgi:N6-adenosine-specific RNA methylase IME4